MGIGKYGHFWLKNADFGDFFLHSFKLQLEKKKRLFSIEVLVLKCEFYQYQTSKAPSTMRGEK